MYHVRVEEFDEPMDQDEAKPIPTRAELIAELENAAAARKQQYKESQAPPACAPRAISGRAAAGRREPGLVGQAPAIGWA